MPIPKDDPRRNPNTDKPVAAGAKRGVGYRLLPGARTFRGQVINQVAHPFPEGTRMGDKEQVTCPVSKAATRWPLFEQGFNLKSPDQYLVGLWKARMIPGLTPEEHATFDGIPTAEEWHDMALSEDQRVIRAWAELNQSRPFDPADFDIGAVFVKLQPAEQEAVKTIILALAEP